MKKKAIWILCSVAIFLFAAAFCIRIFFPGALIGWLFIYSLPGIAFMLLGIAFQKVKGMLLLGQFLFAVFTALALGELFFQVDSKKKEAAPNSRNRIWFDSSGDKIITRNGRKIPVAQINSFFISDNEYFVFQPDLHLIHRSSCMLGNGKKVVAFEAEYTIDSLGFRKVPFRTEKPALPPLLFFGDSFTFGEGVNDNEVFVNLIARKFDKVRNVYNFGVSGKGPAEFVYYLNNGYLERNSLSGKINANAFYLIINDHKYRAVNRQISWRNRYFSLSEKLLQNINYWLRLRVLYNSALCNAVFNGILRKAKLSHYMNHLKNAEDILREKYNTNLTIILYPNCSSSMKNELENAGFTLLDLNKVMPGYKEYHISKVDSKYEIPYDGHPSAKTHALFAAAILEYLEKNKTAEKISRKDR